MHKVISWFRHLGWQKMATIAVGTVTVSTAAVIATNTIANRQRVAGDVQPAAAIAPVVAPAPTESSSSPAPSPTPTSSQTAQKTTTPTLTPTTSPTPTTSQPKQTPFQFTRFPFDIADIGSVAPIGEFAGISRENLGHWYGNYRHYIFSKAPGEYAYNVYAAADGEITGFRNNEGTDQFRFNFTINDQAFYYYDHIQSLTPDILKKLEPYFGNPPRYTQAVEYVNPPIAVKAGDILGQTGLKGIAWDWGIIDESYCQDIVHPEHYAQDRCPRSAYDFMTEDMKTQIAPLAGYWTPGQGLVAVKTTPILGHYAQDVAGTLSGGWLKEAKTGNNAFLVPDSYQPNALQIKLSVNELSLFGVWNNVVIDSGSVNPDPKKVTADSGIVSYVLGQNNRRDTSDYGILLVRVNTDDTITVETLANITTAPDNPSFSSNAVTLSR